MTASGELTPREQNRLAELERIVDAGMQTFVEVGRALQEIRDQRLYRQTHGTFETYLDDRWVMSRAHGYRLIDAARVAELVSPIGDIANEAQARELVPLLDQPEELNGAWEEAVQASNGKPTAAVVAETVKRRTISDEERVTILALHAEGRPQKEIAEAVGWSTAAVSKAVRAAGGGRGEQMPKRRQTATPQTLAIAKLHHAIRDWDKLGDEDYIPAPELARRLRVLETALTFLGRKRADYYTQTGKANQ